MRHVYIVWNGKHIPIAINLSDPTSIILFIIHANLKTKNQVQLIGAKWKMVTHQEKHIHMELEETQT